MAKAAATRTQKTGKLYLGVDVGGTKILAALIKKSGKVLARRRCATPRRGGPDAKLDAVARLAEKLLVEAGCDRDALRAIGLAIPGVVDRHAGSIIVAPNLGFENVPVVERFEKQFGVPIALGNDVNCGIMGEKWLGSASFASSAVGIFMGTGIGGGIIQDNRLVEGCRGTAGEIGHMAMRAGGPECSCGARGCFEALASRSAIERDIRDAVGRGEKTVLTDLAGAELKLIKSGKLNKALQQDDELTRKVLTRAAKVIGAACVNIRHILDPEAIVLGGGVIEKCDWFMMPIIERVVASDKLAGTSDAGKVVVSALGDDAVILGAAALAQQAVGKKPLKRAMKQVANYPLITRLEPGAITVRGQRYDHDVYIRADGKVRDRANALAKAKGAGPHEVTAAELKRVCKRGPATLLVATGFDSQVTVTDDAELFCRRRGIAVRTVPTDQAADAWRETGGRKAVLVHLTA